MKFMTARFLALAMLVPAWSATGQPQESAPPEIRVTGEATVSAEPEQAEIDLGVVTQASSARAAANANAKKIEAVLEAVRHVLGSDATLETQSYSIRPNYHRPRDGGEPTITSYTASNVLRATGVPLDETGNVIDAATGAGANNVSRLEFTVENEEALRLRALGDAARNARDRAEALAAALDLEIRGVLSVGEGEPVVMRPYASASLMQAESTRTRTPVEPGSVEVRARVTLRVEVSAR